MKTGSVARGKGCRSLTFSPEVGVQSRVTTLPRRPLDFRGVTGR